MPAASRKTIFLLRSHSCVSKSKSTDLCFDAGGGDISSQSKRDIGVQLAVTITYSNMYGLNFSRFHHLTRSISCARGQWCFIQDDGSGVRCRTPSLPFRNHPSPLHTSPCITRHTSDITHHTSCIACHTHCSDKDVRYTIQVKYFALYPSCFAHVSQLFHVVKGRWLQGKSRAIGPSALLQLQSLRQFVWNSHSSNAGRIFSNALMHTCTCLMQFFIAIVCLAAPFLIFLYPRLAKFSSSTPSRQF